MGSLCSKQPISFVLKCDSITRSFLFIQYVIIPREEGEVDDTSHFFCHIECEIQNYYQELEVKLFHDFVKLLMHKYQPTTVELLCKVEDLILDYLMEFNNVKLECVKDHHKYQKNKLTQLFEKNLKEKNLQGCVIHSVE